ncbi:signal recognition particle subunit SRP68 [Saccharomyces eubayanus]|uniref:signal recognition particle subunit SRP68 n=1 Tax=Saccharomyces eubayanus TaxID=1080349 RepID=UPI0006BF1EED|nr:SRP68-like protein [Saccharomyces eubayanus]KOG96080.1 SRP68-like protein [Saccharomyces eubayanus]
MVAYSPIIATYGNRAEQFLETDSDFAKYHAKLNKKLQHLRSRCHLTTKDTKKYSSKDKYGEITTDDYDNKTKLIGVLILLHAERDLALAETLKLRARQRGKLKKSEEKVLSTRLKKARKTAEKLVNVTQNESQWITRVQYLAFSKLTHAEYLINGKRFKRKDSVKISNNLALVFATLEHLKGLNLLSEGVVDIIINKYQYTLKQYAGNLITVPELNNFIIERIQSEENKDDELVKLLLGNGFSMKKITTSNEDKKATTNISWRSFNAKIMDAEVAQFLEQGLSIHPTQIPQYTQKLSKLEKALDRHEFYIANHDDQDDMDEMIENSSENNQIILAYIKYNILLTSISREKDLFTHLWSQWLKLNTSIPSRLTKFKEMDRIVKNLTKYLSDVMELPGVYSDEELLNQLSLCKLYFQLFLSTGCLSVLYQSKGRYMEALALYVDAHQRLENKLSETGPLDEILLPGSLLSLNSIQGLQKRIENGGNSVITLAEYEKSTHNDNTGKYDLTIIEKLGTGKIVPTDIQLKNLFPLKPKFQPVTSKPTLFDLAFNYISYDKQEISAPQPKNSAEESGNALQTPISNEQTEEEPKKKRGFLGLFGR